MKIEIRYSYYNDCYVATTTFLEEIYSKASLDSFEVAKEKLINLIKEIVKKPIPEPEEVEI